MRVAVPTDRDDDELRTVLAGWLAERLGVHDVEVGDVDRPGMSGYSNETILLTASWTSEATRAEEHLVVRVEPTGHTVFPDTAFGAQIDVMRALRAEGSVPVPEVLWTEADTAVLGAPFMVMRRVEGRVPADNPSYHAEGWLADASPAVQERVWWSGLEAMAGVHLVDRAAVGLEGLPVLDPAGSVADARAYLDFATDGAGFPAVEAVLDELAASPAPATPPALCWGDARIGNIIFAGDGRAAAVLDWEMVGAGDPLGDLAWFLLLDRHHHEAFGVRRLAGLPARAETLGRWEGLTGRSTEHLWWHELLACARYTAILTRVLLLLDRSGAFPGAAAMAFDQTGSQLLARMVAERS
jgi:aminoglycoside phosphotransferase (APT) family kinase protein